MAAWGFPGILSEIIRADDLVFDVGANIGKMTYAYTWAGARIVAIEPQPYCIAELAKYFGNIYARKRNEL